MRNMNGPSFREIGGVVVLAVLSFAAAFRALLSPTLAVPVFIRWA